MKKTKCPGTWEEFCEQTGRDPKALPDVSMYADRDKKHALADFMLTPMIRHVNGEEVDYKNSDQKKHEIWWDVIEDDTKPSGLGLSYYNFVNWFTGTRTRCGPRFVFLNLADLKWAAKAWLSLFEDLIL